MSGHARKFLITGGNGQLGGSLANLLRKTLGNESVVLTDITFPKFTGNDFTKPFYLDACKKEDLEKVITDAKITGIIHLAALLSATAEKKLELGFELNVHSLANYFLLAKKHNLSLYIPSTIAAFGPDSPLDPSPDVCVQRPNSLYGVGKVYMERLGEYFSNVHQVDFRSLRYPGVISATKPGGGTTDYAVDVFFEGIPTGKYECYLKPETKLPFAHIDDVMENTVKFLLADNKSLKHRVYNYTAFSLTPKDLFATIKERCMPNLEVNYKIDELRQSLADAWPRTLDISNGEKDWGLENKYDLVKLVDNVYEDVSKLVTAEKK